MHRTGREWLVLFLKTIGLVCGIVITFVVLLRFVPSNPYSHDFIVRPYHSWSDDELENARMFMNADELAVEAVRLTHVDPPGQADEVRFHALMNDAFAMATSVDAEQLHVLHVDMPTQFRDHFLAFLHAHQDYSDGMASFEEYEASVVHWDAWASWRQTVKDDIVWPPR